MDSTVNHSKILPYGSWSSPITAEELTRAKSIPSSLKVSGDYVYILESRPSEGGRMALVKLDLKSKNGEVEDVLPLPYNARSRVHEYGGGSFTIGDRVYFSNFSDQRIYMVDEEGPVLLTEVYAEEDAADATWRYADYVFDEFRNQIFSVQECHGDGEPENLLVRIDTGAQYQGWEEIVTVGADFYASPRLNAGADAIVWVEWNHPNMPWDSTRLMAGQLNEMGDILPYSQRQFAGGEEISVCQPQWHENSLYFLSDESGFYNIYRLDNPFDPSAKPMNIHRTNCDMGDVTWLLGTSSYAVLSDRKVLCMVKDYSGIWKLLLLSKESGEQGYSASKIPCEYSFFASITAIDEDKVVFIAYSLKRAPEVVLLDLDSGDLKVLKSYGDQAFGGYADYISTPQLIRFETPAASGDELNTVKGSAEAFALYYPPTNPDFKAQTGELPPLLVLSHGGPTHMARPWLDLSIQYYTSRGFAVADVDYRGSSGYGRAYRKALYGNWGIFDRLDCEAAAQFLVGRGLAHPDKLAIKGGSAGGYTTNCCLIFGKVFSAGSSLYGVSDAELLASDTHKFESRYLDNLIGPYPEAAELYKERSPIHFVEGASTPMIIFQGDEDKVVPPSQSRAIFGALKGAGVPTAYLEFSGEQHGFRKVENQIRCLEAEYLFFSKVFGFTPADSIEEIEIANAGLISEKSSN